MKDVRSTQSFTPIGQDEISLDDEFTPLPPRVTHSRPTRAPRLAPEVQNVEILEDGAPSTMTNFQEPPGNRPSLLSLASPSPRSTGALTPRPTGTAALVDQSAIEQLHKMTHEALIEKAQSLFVATQTVATELIEQLAACDEEKTPTNTPGQADRTKARFRRSVKDLSKAVHSANAEAERLGVDRAALPALAHRQMKEFAQAMDVYDYAVAKKEGGQSSDFSPNELLRATLKKVIDMKKVIRQGR